MSTDTTETETTTETPAVEPTPPPIVRETIQAPHHFSVQETLKLKDELLAAIRNEVQIEAELASVKAEFKSRTEKATLEKDSILRKLTDGFDMRPTKAVILYHSPEHGRKQYVREDNLEVIREEPMSAADYQLPMFRTKDGKDATEPETDDDLDGEVEITAETGKNADKFLNTHDGEGTREDLGRIEDVPGAGQTSVGAALDQAAVNTEQPRFHFKDFGLDDWTPGRFMGAAVKAAKKAGWPEAAASTLRAQLFAMNDVAPMKEFMLSHILNEEPSFEALMADAKSDLGDRTAMQAIFGQIVQHYPGKYPGGNSEQNFNRFCEDVRAAIGAQ